MVLLGATPPPTMATRHEIPGTFIDRRNFYRSRGAPSSYRVRIRCGAISYSMYGARVGWADLRNRPGDHGHSWC